MCGELEEEEAKQQDVYGRFQAHVHSFLAGQNAKGGCSADPVNAHLDSLFREQLLKAADHNQAPPGVDVYERFAMEPLVFARLAGFMAAHMPLNSDPLRSLIDALMTGYNEGEILLPSRDHDHDHDHDHGRGIHHH